MDLAKSSGISAWIPGGSQKVVTKNPAQEGPVSLPKINQYPIAINEKKGPTKEEKRWEILVAWNGFRQYRPRFNKLASLEQSSMRRPEAVKSIPKDDSFLPSRKSKVTFHPLETKGLDVPPRPFSESMLNFSNIDSWIESDGNQMNSFHEKKRTISNISSMYSWSFLFEQYKNWKIIWRSRNLPIWLSLVVITKA